MPEELPLPPLASAPTKPLLTTAMMAVDKEGGGSPPAAGGWSPKPATPVWIGLTAAVCASMVPVLMTLPIPAPWGAVASSVVGAIGAGFGTYLATRSAGPRRRTP